MGIFFFWVPLQKALFLGFGQKRTCFTLTLKKKNPHEKPSSRSVASAILQALFRMFRKNVSSIFFFFSPCRVTCTVMRSSLWQSLHRRSSLFWPVRAQRAPSTVRRRTFLFLLKPSSVSTPQRRTCVEPLSNRSQSADTGDVA